MTLIPDQAKANSSPESYCLLQKGVGGDLSISSLTLALDKVMLGKGATVLDFGCGPGFITAKYLAPLAAKIGAKVFAVDVSKEMIEYAENNNSAPNLYYVAGDFTAKNFPLTGLRFNLIVCNLVLEYLPNPG
jgi:SAM-dependent methyltransferase